jgi:putative DNA methylase
VKLRKKLIEVALPLEAINVASAREKSIRHGHPSTLHLWWARRPLAAARAVIFSQMVDDPSSHPEEFPTDQTQGKERERLFRLIEELVKWENTTNEEVLAQARAEIWKSWRTACLDNRDHPRAKELFNPDKLPGFHDPFAGGGALPLEAQRLGLEAYASDLNPVAVLINKAMIEIPPKFAGQPPVNPDWQEKSKEEKAANPWRGAAGLADDVRYYGKWMRDEAEKRIGHLYPKVEITTEMAKSRPDLKPLVGQKLTVIAWLWARTVKSPNPAFSKVDVPLASTFLLSAKAGAAAYIEPIIEDGTYRFEVKNGKPKNAEVTKNGTKLARGANFKCLMSSEPMEPDYIKAEGTAGRMGVRLMAVVAEGKNSRIYLAPTDETAKVARKAKPTWRPETPLPDDPRNFWTVQYGLKTFGDLFTDRQLVALTTLSDLVQEACERVKRNALDAGQRDDGRGLADGGAGASAYAEAVQCYLALSTDRLADRNCTLCGWDLAQAVRGREATVRNAFSRQALPMVWDFVEVNILSETAGSFDSASRAVIWGLERLEARVPGQAVQADAACQSYSEGRVVSTDPPYYDNIAYADLSDFFYVWLRRSLRTVFPGLFATVAVPKAEELVATPYRHGGKEKANTFFLEGMTQAMRRLVQQGHPAFPATIYYAFKQSESDGADGTASTGWETFLDAVIRAGFAVDGTWPMRTELSNRLIGNDTNALASSIVLVCRQRAADAPTATRRDFITALKTELPVALAHLQRSNIAPVDLAQAAIGPGMAVFTRYSKVLDAEGKPLAVREALSLINQTLDEVLAQQEGDFDADSRWALSWFEQQGFAEGDYGVAETLSSAKNTSVAGLVEAGFLASGRGKVRLLKPSELSKNWDPETDKRLTVWEMVHHLIRVLDAGGETAAAALAKKLGSKAEVARELAYRLYTMCERKKRAPEALAYNALVQSWPEISRLSHEGGAPTKAQEEQTEMFE